MNGADALAAIDKLLDTEYLVAEASELARIPTNVEMGFETYMDPDDPKVVHYVQEIMRPRLAPLATLIDTPLNGLVAVAGRGTSGRSLLIQNYTVAQHHNLMPDPFSGKIASAAGFGYDEPAVFGQGVSQAKGHQAVMLTVLKFLKETNLDLAGRLYWAVNNEGRSSHACSRAIIGALGEKPEFGIIQVGGLRISLGNRGRVDIQVHVEGKASHSSAPELGHNAIEGAARVVERLRGMSWPDRHPLLGGRHALVYKIRYEPLAPHTLPSDAYLMIDRRLLPGDDPRTATAEVAAAIGELSPFSVKVEQGSFMLPALVSPSDPGVEALGAAHKAVTGVDVETTYGQGSFDAGGPCDLGIPTVMYGAKAGVWPLGTDFVPVSQLVTEARVLATLIMTRLG